MGATLSALFVRIELSGRALTDTTRLSLKVLYYINLRPSKSA